MKASGIISSFRFGVLALFTGALIISILVTAGCSTGPSTEAPTSVPERSIASSQAPATQDPASAPATQAPLASAGTPVPGAGPAGSLSAASGGASTLPVAATPSAAASPVAVAMAHFESSKNGFGFDYPADWKLSRSVSAQANVGHSALEDVIMTTADGAKVLVSVYQLNTI